MRKVKKMIMIFLFLICVKCIGNSSEVEVLELAVKYNSDKQYVHLRECVISAKIQLDEKLKDLYPESDLTNEHELNEILRKAYRSEEAKAIRRLGASIKNNQAALEQYLTTIDTKFFTKYWTLRTGRIEAEFTAREKLIINELNLAGILDLFMMHKEINVLLKNIPKGEALYLMRKFEQVYRSILQKKIYMIPFSSRIHFAPREKIFEFLNKGLKNIQFLSEFVSNQKEFEPNFRKLLKSEGGVTFINNEFVGNPSPLLRKAHELVLRSRKIRLQETNFVNLLFSFSKVRVAMNNHLSQKTHLTYERRVDLLTKKLADDLKLRNLNRKIDDSLILVSNLSKTEFPIAFLHGRKVIGDPSDQFQAEYDKLNLLKEKKREYLFSMDANLKHAWKIEQFTIKKAEKRRDFLRNLNRSREQAVKALSDNNEIATLKSENERLKKIIDDAYYSLVPKLKEVTSEEIRHIVKERNRNKVRKVDGYIKNSKAFYTARRKLDKFLYDNNELFKNAQDEYNKLFSSKKEHTHGKKKVTSRKINTKKERLKKRKKLLEKIREQHRLKKLKEKEEK